jgi:transcription elongation GreA/GreB family factor
MPQKLRELARAANLDDFESRCLELLEKGGLPLAEVAECLSLIDQAGKGERVAPLAQMIFENIDPAAQPRAALKLASTALLATPKSDQLHQLTVELYRQVYGQTPAFDAILESSGLTTGAPPRAALRVLDFCLALDVGDTLISRMDDRVVEVAEVDRQRGLFTLRRTDRITTVPARGVVREYERIDPKDFRVLRQLRPDRIGELIERDPVALVIGLINAHGQHIDADQLRYELVPRYIEPKEWSKWWSRARTALKRSPNIIIEGRSPVVLSYSSEGVSLEQETWEQFAGVSDPEKWLNVCEGYLREQKSRKTEPDPDLLRRFREHLNAYISEIRTRRPAEAFACALVAAEIAQAEGVPANGLAGEMLGASAKPAKWIAELKHDVLWERALAELPQARPGDWGDVVAALLPLAPAGQFDRLADALRAAGRLSDLQRQIDDALVDPLEYPELIYWLWKGPKDCEGVRLPDDTVLFGTILDTVVALDTTLTPAPQVGRNFRNRVKSAFALRDYAKVAACLRQTSSAAAVPLKRQIERLEGLGDNARIAMTEALRAAHPEMWITHEVALAPWEDPNTLWATPAGIEKKTAERDELVNVKMRDNAKRIGEAGALGDLSENSEYKFALEERDFLRARLAQINHDLSMARPLGPSEVPTHHVAIGTRVSLRESEGAATRVMTIMGPFEANVDAGILSYRAPVPQKLMGLRIGERAKLPLDGGEREYEVVSIENALLDGR